MNEAFKKQIEDDISNCFLNNDEFADYHLIDGNKMHVVFDKYSLEKNNAKREDGIYVDELLIYVSVKEFGPKPRTGRTIIIDERKAYRIVDVVTEGLLYSMQLEAVRG